jgi:ABC-type dipeptide/oligopeptide/nickel transport system permease subunit
MTAWEMVGAIIAFAQLVLAFLVAASLPKVSRAGAGSAATIYLIVAFASVVWIARSAMWQQ